MQVPVTLAIVSCSPNFRKLMVLLFALCLRFIAKFPDFAPLFPSWHPASSFRPCRTLFPTTGTLDLIHSTNCNTRLIARDSSVRCLITFTPTVPCTLVKSVFLLPESASPPAPVTVVKSTASVDAIRCVGPCRVFEPKTPYQQTFNN